MSPRETIQSRDFAAEGGENSSTPFGRHLEVTALVHVAQYGLVL
jgi:hypothetical protein